MKTSLHVITTLKFPDIFPRTETGMKIVFFYLSDVFQLLQQRGYRLKNVQLSAMQLAVAFTSSTGTSPGDVECCIKGNVHTEQPSRF